MDEREAYDLFTPARERTLPQPRISMAEVYEVHARRHRAQRWTAVGGSVTVVLLVVSGTFWATHETGTRDSVGTTVTPSAPAPPNLEAFLLQVAVPADAVRAIGTPSPEATGATHFVGEYRQETWDWTTTSPPATTIAAVNARPPASLHSFTSGGGTGPGDENDASISYQGEATADHSAVELDIAATQIGQGPTHVSATAWVVMRKPKPTNALVLGSIESLVGTVNPADVSVAGPGSVAVPTPEAGKIAILLNSARMSTSYDAGPHECGPNPRQTTLTFHTSQGFQVFSMSCGGLSAGTGPDAVLLEVPAGLQDEVDGALAALLPKPSPSFAPTPGIGTLDIGILVVGGPAPGINDPTSAGTITVAQNGKRVGGGTVKQGHRLSVHLPVGTYQVQAAMGGACPPVTVNATSGSVTQVEARCDIK